ncbi:MAG: hypothetical protein IJP90_00785, partial [Treponema sp.]|nr:hypothetical protein [Treponema sp.]
EFYLKVGNDYVFGTKKNSAGNIVPLTQKLSIPTSPAGTSDAALQSRWVKVVIANGVPTATLEKKVDEPVNVTLAHIQMDLRNVENESDLPTGVTCKVSDSDATDATKYTLKITGLESNAGTVLVLSGAAIGETAAEAKTNAADTNLFSYNKNSSVFKQTISEKGEVEWTFYGAKSPWREFYTEICISDYNNGEGDQNSNNRLLDNLNSLDGGAYPKNANFVFPKYAWNKSEVTLTIDRSKLDSTSVTQADPVVAAAEIYIDAIKVTNCPEIGQAGYLAFLAGWLADNQWNNTTKYKITDSGFITSDNSAYLLVSEKYKPNSKTFQLDMQVVNPAVDSMDGDVDGYFWADAGKVVKNDKKTPVLQTEDYAGKHWILVCERASTTASDIYNIWLEPVADDTGYKEMYGYANVPLVENVVDNFVVQGWYTEDWISSNSVLTKIDAFNWKWIVITTEAMPSYKFSIIKEIDDWNHGRYELANTHTLTANGTSVGPMNYNNEPPTRATINLAANSTYTFTLTNTKKGMFVKVTKN